VLSLARGLDQRAHEITVALPEHLDKSIAALQETDAQIVPLAMRKVAWSPEAIAAFLRLLRDQEFDVVHVHSQEAGLVVRPLARLAGAKAIVYTPQTIDIRRARWQWLYRSAERLLAAVTDKIISVNESDRQRLIAWGIPPAKVETIPNGISLVGFEQPVPVGELRHSLGVELDRPLVMQMGRLRAQKNPLAFVEGAAEVARECPDAQFALVGDGPLRDEVIARIEQLGLQGAVRCLGWHDDGYRLIAAADILSLTSLWEGTPFTLLEAMAWSRPVVATAVNGCPEIILDKVTGFLVPPGDTTAWARRVVDLLHDPAKAISMGKQGRRRVEEKFAMPAMLSQIGSLYRGL
jgi:glycosyltransferase involved in cell wall biosynthesis